MIRELYQIEYVFKNASASVLWKLIGTASGLSEWFADDVDESSDGILTFHWGKSSQEAVKLTAIPEKAAKYRWLDDDDKYYFEFKISKSDLTKDIVLIITDFAEPSEKNSSIGLWNSQIENMMRRSGM